MSINKESLKRQFFMRHMPNMLTGDYHTNLTAYYQELRDNANPDGSYDISKYKTLAYEFFEGKVDNPREMVAYIFGTGQNKFWCFENNITDVPMTSFDTVYDVIDKLEDIQKEILEEDGEDTYEKDHEVFNLWCCTSEPFENIIINSSSFIISNSAFYRFGDLVDSLCRTQDDYDGQIMVDDDGLYVNTEYHDDPINELVKTDMMRQRHNIDRKYNAMIIDRLIEKYPNTIVKSITDTDIVSYMVVNHDDSKNIKLENFFESINTFNIINVEDSEKNGDSLVIDGEAMLDWFIEERTNEYNELYAKLYAKHKADIDAGVAKLPKKTMGINLSGLM